MNKTAMSEIFKNSFTFRLFKKEPSFVDGIASLVNIIPSASRYNINATEIEADTASLRADWFAIGEDFWKAIQEYERGQQKTTAG